MNKNGVLCSLVILISIMSHNSFASVETYYLDGYCYEGDLNGFVTYESVGVTIIK